MKSKFIFHGAIMSPTDFKVVLLGAGAVGKTSLVQRFVNERFNENLSYQNTIGAAFASKQVQIDGKKLTMGIWDTAGTERYKAMTRMYYRNAKAAVVCCDITIPDTFQKAKFWIRELRNTEEQCIIYFCITKKDLLDQQPNRAVEIEAARQYASGIGAKFFISSSKTGENIEELFTEIGKDYLSDPENLKTLEENITLQVTRKKLFCC